MLLEGSINMIHCLFSKYKAFILMFTIVPTEKKDISSIPMVCEFLDVFLEDFTSFPSERKVEFSIDIVSEKALVSIAPYEMSLVEL